MPRLHWIKARYRSLSASPSSLFGFWLLGFHIRYLSGVAEKLTEDLDEELWNAEDLKIPVFQDGM